MLDNEIRPFLAAQRHDPLRSLVASRNDKVQRQILARVGRSVSPTDTKIDGKGGSLDGTPAIMRDFVFNPAPLANPAVKTAEFKGPNSKEGKETKEKESKEFKDGKETKDKETKESKDKEGKEAKEGKETKESKDKEGKEFSKEAKDKENKETKEIKEIKEGKEKEGKELTFEKPPGESIFIEGLPNPSNIQLSDSLWRKGNPADLPWNTFNSIAEAHPNLVASAIDRGRLGF